MTEGGPAGEGRAEGKRCPRCEADLPSPEALAAAAAASPLAPPLRAAEGVYAARLAACARCDSLRGGVLCAHCGCFVIFRARPQAACCPHPGGGRWGDAPPALDVTV